MNLQWELTDVVDSDSLCWTKRDDGRYQLTELTQSIVDFTALVGISKLTDKTAKEFARRLGILKIIGVPVPSEITHESINKHIGLETSAVRMDYRKFKNNVFDSLETASKNALEWENDAKEEKDERAASTPA